MSIVVVGSIAFDTIQTPFGRREKSLGGAANYFSVAARFFGKVLAVGIVGEDFPRAHLDHLEALGVDISGIERVPGASFHWHGEYGYDLNEAKTINTELNVFKHFKPTLPEHFRDARMIFLANIDPELQIHVLSQMRSPQIKALDTMNYWIDRKNSTLKQAISMIDILIINDAEIRALTGEHNMVKAVLGASKMGARIVVVKRGEYGSLLSFDNQMIFVPAYPLEDVYDPTGAGDTFAAGFLGSLLQCKSLDILALKQAMLMGTVMSSFVIEKFSFDRMLEVDMHAIEKRKERLINMTIMDNK